jgi:MFS family permease
VSLAAIVGIVLAVTLNAEQMNRWGWRVPLVIGCLIVPVLFILRRTLTETEDFASRAHHPSIREVIRTVGENWPLIGLGMLMATLTTVCFYLITAYTPTFGGTVLRLGNTQVQLVILCVGLSNLMWLPVMGALSDRIGRRPILLACTLLTLATAYPAMQWLVAAPSFTRLLTVELWFSCLFGSYSGAMFVYLTEIMPRHVRTAGFSVAFSLATAIFGGFTPAVCTYLIERTGNRAVPGLWLSAAALMALVAVVQLGWRAPRVEATVPAIA